MLTSQQPSSRRPPRYDTLLYGRASSRAGDGFRPTKRGGGPPETADEKSRRKKRYNPVIGVLSFYGFIAVWLMIAVWVTYAVLFPYRHAREDVVVRKEAYEDRIELVSIVERGDMW